MNMSGNTDHILVPIYINREKYKRMRARAFDALQLDSDSDTDSDVSYTLQSSDCNIDYYSILTVQSKDSSTPDVVETESSTDKENVLFNDKKPVELTKFNPITDNSFYSDHLPNTDLANFLKRPVEIDSFSWVQGSTFIVQRTLDPWKLFYNNATIKKKIDNYSFISSNLHIKIVINASPFLYGRMIATYRPMAGWSVDNIGTVDTGSRVIYSQRPHITIDASSNSAGEMILPFFYNKNWLDITKATDFDRMGTFQYILLSSLASANGAVGSTVQITTYAWAEDVRLCGPTSKLALQSKDEYGQGPISAPASAIAEAAGYLENIPVIGRFATATRLGASAVSSIASLFGFTNVPVIEDVKPYKSLTFHSLASSQIAEPVEKLTLDPKNELSIDPHICGLDVGDELNISALVTKESFLTSTTWLSSANKDDLLFSATVCPLMGDYFDTGLEGRMRNTPMAHFQYLFWNWRGDIIYTLKFVKTPYHKGRLRVSWDPTGDIIANVNTTTSVYTRIVDISETDEVEMRIPYLQALPWLKTRQSQPSRGGLFDWWQLSGFTYEHDPEYTNGTFTIRVLNEVSGPTAAADIEVLIYVKAADNFEFANPSDFFPSHSVFTVQSKDEDTLNFSDSGSQDPNRYLVNFGECVKSLRTLLRRSTLAYVQTQDILTTQPYTIVHSAQTRIPPSWGYDPNGINTANSSTVPKPFNFVQRVPYNWIAPCFMARRGSMIWHYNVDATDGSSAAVRLERLITPISLTNFDSKNYQDFALSTSQEMRFFTNFANGLPIYGAGLGGVALTNQKTQSGLSALLPMYNNYRFEMNSPLYNNFGDVRDGSNSVTFDLTTTVRKSTAVGATNSVVTQKYCSIGTDFNLIFFLNVPTMYAYGQPTAP